MSHREYIYNTTRIIENDYNKMNKTILWLIFITIFLKKCIYYNINMRVWWPTLITNQKEHTFELINNFIEYYYKNCCI